MRAADILTPIDAAGAGADYLVNSPLWIEETPKVPPRLAPKQGEHTRVILEELGLTADEIAELTAGGAIE